MARPEQGAAVQMMRRCQTEADVYSKALQAAPHGDSAVYYARSNLNETVRWLNFMRGLYAVLGSNI